MLGVRNHGLKPVLRLVERRTRRELIPLILHHVRTGSTILSDEWRAYRQALAAFAIGILQWITVLPMLMQILANTSMPSQCFATRKTLRGHGGVIKRRLGGSGETAPRTCWGITSLSLSGTSGWEENTNNKLWDNINRHTHTFVLVWCTMME